MADQQRRVAIAHERGDPGFGDARDGGARNSHRSGRALEEPRRCGVERLRDQVQAGGADAVGAVLVFLHLLETDAEGAAELVLAQPEQIAAQAYARADMDVDRSGALASHMMHSVTYGHIALSKPS